jgi:FkbM family methyltransferase
MITYAQNFEDVLLARLFQGQSEGFYIDVGAWHPKLHSVTKHFYDLGWSGINVEPIQRQHRLFVEERPRDQNLNAAVGDVAGRLRFHECKDLTSLSTADAEQAEALRLAGHEIESYEVQVLTLNEIFSSCGRPVDFLKVDVEGFEAAVLQGIDWQQHRPRVLLIEATLPAVKIEDWDHVDSVRNWDAWEPAVLAAGYQFAWYDGLSRFYVRDEEAGLKRRLALPACVHDEFEFADRHELIKDRLQILDANSRLVAELEAVKVDRAAKADVVDRLIAEVAGLNRRLAALMKNREQVLHANRRLETNLHAVEVDRAAKADVIKSLNSHVEELETAKRHLVEDQEEMLGSTRPLMVELVAGTSGDGESHHALNSDVAKQVAAESGALKYLANDLERLTVASAIMEKKLAAKDQVIESFAIRDLERKALLRGVPDLAYYWRRNRVPPGYGDYFPAEKPGFNLHIAVDTLELVFGVSGGVETYMKMLTNALLEGGQQVTLICLPDHLPDLRRQFGSRVGYFVMRKSQGMGFAIHRLGRPKRLSAATSMATFSQLRQDIGADVLHSPVQVFSALDFRIPSVLNLHDLQHLHFPENFQPTDIEARNHLYGLSAALADAIVVSSDFVRTDLIERMHVPASKVFTVPVTWDPMVIDGLAKFSVQDAVELYKLPPTYALYPAQFWPHKNHARLVEALRIVRDKRPGCDLKLVFTGYRGHSGWPKVEATIQQQGLAADVICLDHVPVDHLAALYKGAIYCVMPSTFEASSYPVIEAQVLGVPAMCSNVTSLPELMRDEAGLLFDPFDVEDIAAKMVRWLDDAEDRQAHAERALSRACEEHSLANYVTGLGRVYNYAVEARAKELAPN